VTSKDKEDDGWIFVDGNKIYVSPRNCEIEMFDLFLLELMFFV
jgi:hypothetical protein